MKTEGFYYIKNIYINSNSYESTVISTFLSLYHFLSTRRQLLSMIIITYTGHLFNTLTKKRASASAEALNSGSINLIMV